MNTQEPVTLTIAFVCYDLRKRSVEARQAALTQAYNKITVLNRGELVKQGRIIMEPNTDKSIMYLNMKFPTAGDASTFEQKGRQILAGHGFE